MANIAIVQRDYGSGMPWEKVELVQKERPQEVKPGHVLIKISLRPIKRSDLLFLRGNNFKSINPEFISGTEGAGIVDAVGEGVEKFKVGQRVVPFFYSTFLATGYGTWQQYLEVLASETFPIPDDVTDEVACQLFGNPFTAYTFFDKLRIPKGEYLLQTAASGHVGRLIIRLAKHYGIKTINLVRRNDTDEELKKAGADVIINYTTEDVVERVKEVTGGKLAFAAVDAVAGQLTKVVASSVRNGGQLFIYGMLSGFEITFDVRDIGFGTIFGRNVQVSYFVITDYVKTAENCTRVGKEVVKLFQDKVWRDLDADSYRRFSLSDFKVAIRMAQEATGGKKILFTS